MKEMISRLCAAYGVGGVGNINSEISDMIRPLADELYTDSLGSMVAIRRCGKHDAPLVMLEAHIDEIGFVVTHVDDDGFVHVSSCGGIDRRVLAATEVVVLAEEPLVGVFCSTPPHLSDGDNTVKPLEDMGIDVGLSAEEAKKRILQGTRVAFLAHTQWLGEHRICAKSLDDRAGCAAVIRALELLRNENIACDVVALFAVQEEIGGAGASVAAFATKPTAAIVTDVSFAHTPDAARHQCGILGEGAMLGIAPTLDRALTMRLKEVADTAGIPCQDEVMGGSTGTDADKIGSVCEGVKTALLSIPQRYMHTPVEIVDVRDIESVAQLMATAVKEGVIVC